MHVSQPRSIVHRFLLLSPLVLALAGPADGKSIGKDQVNIRQQPSLNSPILFTAPLGYPIEVKKQDGDWIYFRDWQDNSGWVYKSLVSEVDTAVVVVDKANIRSAARVNSSVVANAELGEIYTIIGKDGNWVRLGYYHSGTAIGWMRDDLIFGE